MTSLILGYATVHPSKLKPSPDNPRRRLKTTDPARYGLLKASLEKGQWQPVLVEQSSMKVISGHQRWEVAKELDLPLAVCYLRDLTETERKEIMVQANTTSGFFDLPKLAMFTADLDIPSLALDPVTLDALAPLDVQPLPKDEEQNWTTLKIKVTTDQVTTIEAAIKRVRELNESPKMKDGSAMELICADFLSGH